MKFCEKCLLPDTRPEVEINSDGVCSACLNSMEKYEDIDWVKRKKNLEDTLDKFRDKSGLKYDCLVPVSGGKDSTWQIHTLLEYGMNPLAYTFKCAYRTDLGKRNLQNLINLGVSHIDFSVNPRAEKKFMLKSLELNGSPSISEHMGQFAATLKLAIAFEIPLVVYGENSALEYGGSGKNKYSPLLDYEWLKRYGATNGTFAEDWIGDDLTQRDMSPFCYPSEDELNKANLNVTFLGYFLQWNPLDVAIKARELGLEWSDKPLVGSWPYADLDCDFIVIHHFFKWVKFGFTRAFDNLSIDYRNGKISREEAVSWLNNNVQHVPLRQIRNLCEYLEISLENFWGIVESHRNKDIWYKDDKGIWKIKDFPDEIDFNNIYPEIPQGMG